MYMLITYDVEARRTERFRKLLSRYLVHEQNSVFAGDLLESKLRKLEAELNRMMEDNDHVLQILAENRHNVSVKILKKRPGNRSLVKECHLHHSQNADII